MSLWRIPCPLGQAGIRQLKTIKNKQMKKIIAGILGILFIASAAVYANNAASKKTADCCKSGATCCQPGNACCNK